VICFSFTSTSQTVNMNSDACRGSYICSPCFVALPATGAKTLKIVSCSSTKYKSGSAMSSSQVVEMMIMNTDTDDDLEVQACADAPCSTPVSSYTLQAGASTVAFCYGGGSNAIYFPSTVLLSQSTISFAGKTITDLGQVTTADINGGTIDDTDITMGSGTLDVSGGTLVLANGQIPANKITAGAFTAGQIYNFASSTIQDLGTVLTASLQGGSITGMDVTVPTGKTLDITNGNFNFAAGQVSVDKLGPATFNTGTYSLAGSTISDAGTMSTVNIDGGTIDGVTMQTSDITITTGKTLDASAGTLTLAAGQVPAASVGAGTFDAGGAYSFAGSTITNLGMVNTGDINGGTADSLVIGSAAATTAKFTTLQATSTFRVTTGAQAAFGSPTLNKQAGIVFSSVMPTAGSTDSFTVFNSYVTGQSVHAILGTAGPCLGGVMTLLNIATTTNSFTAQSKNTGGSDCTGFYHVMFFSLPD